jgi:5-formyltetrahydrofolate cyclo-ligase
MSLPAPGPEYSSGFPSLDKAQLRAHCRWLREELGEAFRADASQRICERIQWWPGYPSTGTVLTYLPMKGEVDLRPLIDAAPDIRWAIPRVVDAPMQHLVFHVFDADRLIPHRYGMLEPDPGLPVVEPKEADLILVPGLAFTRTGYRLGYGGGYYDRLLPALRHTSTLGACFQALLLAEIPREAHDVPVGFVVTEELGVVETPGA